MSKPVRVSTYLFRQVAALAGLFVLCSSSVMAQSSSPGSISGRVVLPNGGAITHSIRISLETMRGVKANVFTDNQGGFVFRSLAPGSYQVIVEGDRTLWETTAASVEVFPGAPAILTIVLRERKASANSGGGAISATELEVSVPPRARKEFERAIDAGLEGKAEESILHLRKAIEYYPGYLMAHNDLGAQLLEQGKLVEAEAELRTAIGIDPKAFNPHLNLGIVLVKNKRYLEAKEILTEAVSQVSNSPSARLYLGQALEGLNELPAATKEFITTFELGGDDYAIALFHLGNVYLKTGDRSGARKAFERYVAAAPRGPNVGEAKRQIALLQ